jgi:hypothetical protein
MPILPSDFVLATLCLLLRQRRFALIVLGVKLPFAVFHEVEQVSFAIHVGGHPSGMKFCLLSTAR